MGSSLSPRQGRQFKKTQFILERQEH